MKTTDKIKGLTSRENVKAENELLKVKLGTEFGMKEMRSELPAELENDWLNYVYNFENLSKDAKEISVFERLGKPEFKKTGNMSDEEIASELSRLHNQMEQNGLALDFLCDYDDKIKYNFITEELFAEVIDDIRMEGMRTNFIYEEFHPNHEYDIKEAVNYFFRFFLSQEMNEEHIGFIYLNDEITYKDKKISKEEYVKIMKCFREEIKPAGVELLEFYDVNFDPEKEYGTVSGEISYSVLENGVPSAHVSDVFKIDLIFNEYCYWLINGASFP